METVKGGLLDCGSITGQHVAALRELWEHDARLNEVVVACDIDEEMERERASELEEFQGMTPAVFTDVDRMPSSTKGMEAVDVCTQHVEHHSLATACLQEGRDVIIEKPLTVTLRAAKRVMEEARQSRRILAVAENYRRSPHERAKAPGYNRCSPRFGCTGRIARNTKIEDLPEVDGVEGYKALVLCMAVFESAKANRAVSFREIEQLELEAYQQEINDAIGLSP